MSTATYHHEWAAPFIVALVEKAGEGAAPRRLWTARQECFRCGTMRNPFTDRITKYRGSKDPTTGLHPCQRTVSEEKPYPWARLEQKLAMDLRAIEADGHRVQATHPDADEVMQRQLI